MKKLKTTIITIMAGLGLFMPMALPVAVSAQNSIKDGICAGTEITVNDPDCSNSGAATTINELLKTIINILSFIVGFVAVVMIMIGGFKYITSGGEPGNVTSAKNTILYAIIGLVVVAFAQVIVQFVLSKL